MANSYQEVHAMTATIIDGKAIGADVREKVKSEVAQLKAQVGDVPGLATVLVGDNKASAAYVRMKGEACAEAGIYSVKPTLPATATQEQVEGLVRELNADPRISGILVQLPLPPQINERAVLSAVSLEKDVDGFHPINIGRLAMKGHEPLFIPCTPYGVMVLLERTGVKLEGSRAVVLGRSNIVGLPVALLLLHANATVTVCHSRTRDLPSVVREADVLVAAVGRAEIVRRDWVKPGAVVIDVGTNPVADPTKKSGQRLVGDVAFDEVKEVASAITPVPGGVGPMTIAMLLANTLRAFKAQRGITA
jgi:5,10-methylene-tetrahydrofolate dehydrogenase/methenyl tetrahydrofolate cyclohydrolase